MESEASSCDRAPVHHAAECWAELVWRVARLERDPTTLGKWAKAVGMSESTLRSRCYRACVSPKRSLALARVLRVLVIGRSTGELPSDLLDAKDPRTTARLLAHAKLQNHTAGERWPTPGDFVEFQSVVVSRWAQEALSRRLHVEDAQPAKEMNPS